MENVRVNDSGTCANVECFLDCNTDAAMSEEDNTDYNNDSIHN